MLPIMVNVGELFSHPEKPGVFITAEIGINHNGSIDFAKKLIESAKSCGADAVKFQTFQTGKFYNKALAPEAFELFQKFELTYDSFFKLKEFADSLGILFYATPLDFESLDFLIGLNVPVIKVASSDITNEPFLYRIRQKALHKKFAVFISTGFAEIRQIGKVITILKDCPVALEYCVSKYPPDETDFDLRFIETLRKQFFVPIGFSDHSLDIYYSLAAVSLGAKMIERHFTTDNSIQGADHAMSLGPAKFSEMVKGIRAVEKALGEGVKKVTRFERDISYPSMRGLYMAQDVKKGEMIKEEDVILLRPGNGVSIQEYRRRINRKAKKDMIKYEKL
jgi:N,N'-diacetyllegionaminate synthase